MPRGIFGIILLHVGAILMSRRIPLGNLFVMVKGFHCFWTKTNAPTFCPCGHPKTENNMNTTILFITLKKEKMAPQATPTENSNIFIKYMSPSLMPRGGRYI